MKKLLLLTFLIFSSSVFAGILVEPYLGYRTGGYEQSVTGEGLYSYDHSGHEYGLRLGGSYLGFMAGLQYGIGVVDTEVDTQPATGSRSGKAEFDTTVMGAFVGFSGIPFFRVWGTYFFNYDWESKKEVSTRNVDNKEEYNGSGYSLGVGFTGIPFISLNLEYRLATFDENKSNEGTYKLPHGNDGEMDVKEIFLSVSAPFNFF